MLLYLIRLADFVLDGKAAGRGLFGVIGLQGCFGLRRLLVCRAAAWDVFGFGGGAWLGGGRRMVQSNAEQCRGAWAAHSETGRRRGCRAALEALLYLRAF